MRRIPAIPPVALVLVAVLGLAPSPPAARAEAAPAGSGWTVSRVTFEPLDGDTSLGILGRHDYRGALEVAPLPDTGNVVAINAVGLEDYLLGISEVPVSWPLEAQKAQAIAARTYLLHQMDIEVGTSWRAAGADICATQACQVYLGLAKERREGAEAWARAVAATAGTVLVHNGQPILAKYSSSNGGRSTSGGRSYLPAIDDPDDVHSPLHQWRSSVGLGEVAAIYGLGDRLRWVRSAGTIVELTEVLPGGEERRHHVAGPDFRERLNAALPAPEGLPWRVPSVRFAVWTDVATGTVFVEGRGYGHGIGMSQYGALGKAQRGLTAEEILASYYGGLRPVTVPPAQLPSTVRVAVEDSSRIDVSSAGRFRVVAGDGRVLAHVADGTWTVRRAGDALEVVPPEGQGALPAITGVDVDAPAVTGEEPTVVRFGLTAPALVDVTVERPGAPALAFDSRPASAGELTYQLPADRQGHYRMTVRARAGHERETSVPISFHVGELPARAVPELASFAMPVRHPNLTAVVGLAGAAWLVVVGALAAFARRLQSSTRLH